MEAREERVEATPMGEEVRVETVGKEAVEAVALGRVDCRPMTVAVVAVLWAEGAATCFV